MKLVDFAEQYCAERGLARNPVHSASRFERLMGNHPPDQISSELLTEFRKKCEEKKLGSWTIRGTLKDVRTLARAAGVDVKIETIRPPQPEPQPIPLATIDAIWSHLADWSRQWLVLSYWTGLRLADSIRFQKALEPEKLQWTARKTGHRQKWPIMAWMTPFLQPAKLPYSSTDDWCKVIVRAELDRVCTLAGVDRFLPSQIRDTSMREWCRADFHVGQILHGCKLGVIGHYVDILDILEPVAPRVRLPKCFNACAEESEEATLLASFRKLDPAAQSIITTTAARFASR